MNKFGWTENDEGQIFIFNQEESVKPKNIVEKIDFESEFCSIRGDESENAETLSRDEQSSHTELYQFNI